MTTSDEQFRGHTPELIPHRLVQVDNQVHHPAVLHEAVRRNKDCSYA